MKLEIVDGNGTSVPISKIEPGTVFVDVTDGQRFLRLDDTICVGICLESEAVPHLALDLADFTVDAWNDALLHSCRAVPATLLIDV